MPQQEIKTGRHSRGGKTTTKHKRGCVCECGWRGNDAKCLNRHINKCLLVKNKPQSEETES